MQVKKILTIFASSLLLVGCMEPKKLGANGVNIGSGECQHLLVTSMNQLSPASSPVALGSGVLWELAVSAGAQGCAEEFFATIDGEEYPMENGELVITENLLDIGHFMKAIDIIAIKQGRVVAGRRITAELQVVKNNGGSGVISDLSPSVSDVKILYQGVQTNSVFRGDSITVVVGEVKNATELTIDGKVVTPKAGSTVLTMDEPGAKKIRVIATKGDKRAVKELPLSVALTQCAVRPSGLCVMGKPCRFVVRVVGASDKISAWGEGFGSDVVTSKRRRNREVGYAMTPNSEGSNKEIHARVYAGSKTSVCSNKVNVLPKPSLRLRARPWEVGTYRAVPEPFNPKYEWAQIRTVHKSIYRDRCKIRIDNSAWKEWQKPVLKVWLPRNGTSRVIEAICPTMGEYPAFRDKIIVRRKPS